ncbi:ceramidase [Amanita rubescens]|nr:ceramidase [Amanita rubescens]
MASISEFWVQNQGFFDPVTATLDWCEANYQFSYYIAEMANSFSNLFTIALAACGYLEARRQNLPQRYLIGYIGVALVGIGSFAFHATLLYEAQLADELPMIYVGSMSLWLIFDDQPGFDLQRSRTKWMIFLLIAFDVLFTLSYCFYRNPVYHQLVFASIVFIVAFRITHTLKYSKASSGIPPETKTMIGKLFATGAALFALGFLIWNMDNTYCTSLTDMKRALGYPAAFFLEGHAWWHILTGAGTYYMFSGVQSLADVTLCLKDSPDNYTVNYKYFLPHIIRQDKPRI